MKIRVAAITALTLGASGVLAAPAWADPLDGSYTMTATGGTGTRPKTGVTQLWVFTPCGPDCSRLEIEPPSPETIRDYHLLGDAWFTSDPDRSHCDDSIDSGSLVGHAHCRIGTWDYYLTKNG